MHGVVAHVHLPFRGCRDGTKLQLPRRLRLSLAMSGERWSCAGRRPRLQRSSSTPLQQLPCPAVSLH